MTIKLIIKLCSLVLVVILMSQCDKKFSEVILEEDVVEEIIEEPISYDQPTDRNDIPPPPLTPWWTIDLTQLTICQRKIWVYLKFFYPINDNENPEYQLYSVKNQTESLYSINYITREFERYFNREFPERYLYNEEYSCQEELDAGFFKGALGEPTCIAHNHRDSVITYFYYTKFRFRHGPCPFTRYNGEEIGVHCGSVQIRYCATLKVIFSMETGQLVYIDFST